MCIYIYIYVCVCVCVCVLGAVTVGRNANVDLVTFTVINNENRRKTEISSFQVLLFSWR